MNKYMSSTTPEQRASILWHQKSLAAQGYYPWAIPPFGFDKVKVNGNPTLRLNRVGKIIVETYLMVLKYELRSKRDAAGFLMAAVGIEITPTKAMSILRNPVHMGLLQHEGNEVVGQYRAGVTAEQFSRVQSIISKWGKR